MDHRPKTLKRWADNLGENLCDIRLGNNFILRHRGMKRKRSIDKFDFIESKIFCSSKDPLQKIKQRRVFAIYPMKGWYPEYIKNDYNLPRGQTAQSKSGQKIYTDTSKKNGW